MKFIILILFMIFSYTALAVNNIQSSVTGPLVQSLDSNIPDYQLTGTDINRLNPCSSFANYNTCVNNPQDQSVCVKYPIQVNTIVNGSISGYMVFDIENNPINSFFDIKIFQNGNNVSSNPVLITSNSNNVYEVQYCIKYSGAFSRGTNQGNVFIIMGVN